MHPTLKTADIAQVQRHDSVLSVSVHVNQVRSLLMKEKRDQTEFTNWTPPLFHYEEGPMSPTSEEPLEVQDGSLRVGLGASLRSDW